MRIDEPLCNIKICRNNFDGNCKRKTTYNSCEFKNEMAALIDRIYEKYPDDKDIWLLLQSVVELKQKVYKIYDDLYK